MCVRMCVKPVLTSIGNVSISLDFRLYYLHTVSPSFSLPEGAIKLASLPDIYLLMLSISTKTA